MNYSAALKRLMTSGQNPKLGLDRMQALLAALGSPQLKFKAFHVAGTNGKGSVCAFLSAILSSARIPHGVYTSPHLLCARERIRLFDGLISEEEFCRLEEQVHQAVSQLSDVSFFERVTAMAFLAFAQRNYAVNVIEVGLGGRLDATNLVEPLVCGITSLSLDHTSILGDTLAQIAAEKAGIIKPGIPVISALAADEVRTVLKEKSAQLGAPISFVPPNDFGASLALIGPHQAQNAAVACAMLSQSGLDISPAAYLQGLEHAFWPCRFELIEAKATVLLDGAHNPDGIAALMTAISNHPQTKSRPIALVFGASVGHSVEHMVSELERYPMDLVSVFAVKAQTPRAMPAEEVQQAFLTKRACHMRDSIAKALEEAMDQMAPVNGLVLVTGSLFVAGEARGYLTNMPQDPILPHY